MKVIEDKKSTWSLAATCPDCESSIEIEASDVYWQSLGCFDEFETYYRADCGACGSQIDITQKIPQWVKSQASKDKPKNV